MIRKSGAQCGAAGFGVLPKGGGRGVGGGGGGSGGGGGEPLKKQSFETCQFPPKTKWKEGVIYES